MKLKELITNLGKGFAEFVENVKSKFSDDSWNMSESFKTYLNNLNVEGLCIVFNIIGCLFIIFCFISIIFVLWGNFILEYFNLEQKFPWLAKFMNLRRKLVNYNLILNFTLIIIVLVLMIYVNIFTLI
jgi:hypothetical protein